MNGIDGFLSKKQLGFADNKQIPIVKMHAIDIKRFRSFTNQLVQLGDHVTVFSGRNGTMKTSLMGLIAHPFDSDAKDAFGSPLKTALKDVFRLSAKYDSETYDYDLIIETDKPTPMREPVSMYYVAEKTNRHRIVVSGAEQGDGNFIYNTSFLNLKRLYPLVDTKAKPDASPSLTDAEKQNLKSFYEAVLPSTSYGSFAAIHEKKLKTTFAPDGDTATYDWNSISSGEDNLGAIFNRLLGFQRAFSKGQAHGNGILCIDEFESSLHPVAQLRLFDYLYRWAETYKVQLVISTHSLHLIQHIYLRHLPNLDANRIVVNFVSKSTAIDANYPIVKNPPYELAYRELTLQKPIEVAEARKVKVFCEDDLAIHFAKSLIKSRDVLRLVEFHSSLNPASPTPGTGYNALKSLCIQFPLLLTGSLVLFDADVADTVTSLIKNKDLYLRLPDADGLALERRIIYFIASLKNDDAFFVKFDMEREAFLDSFSSYQISLTASDIADETKVPISACKNWANSNKTKFKQYVTYYCGTLRGVTSFASDFLAKINKINASSGLPAVII